MQKTIYYLFFFSLSFHCFAQSNGVLDVSEHQLDNGFKVFLNHDTTVSNVFGAVIVNAGAKDESIEATGMAHYLEHMLFKGTEAMGTTDYQAEKVYLDSIRLLYNLLSQTTDQEKRFAIQKAINQQSIKASKYGLPNEFVTLLKSIGGKNINAFTSYDMTCYHNEFPADQMERWLDLYATRFQKPVLRSFQSELEVVYEEKNRSSDQFTSKIFRTVNELMFPNLPYGQWEILGKTDHLKNPPLQKTYDFFDEYYVASNMALVLVGNFDKAQTLQMIQQKFGKLKKGKAKEASFPTLRAIKGVETTTVRYTPVGAGILGFQTVSLKHKDRVAVDVCEYLLSNSEETGFIDQLLANNELMYGGTFDNTYNEAGGLVIFYVPKLIVQNLKGAEKKIASALEKLRNGDFSAEVLSTAKINLSKSFQEELENKRDRAVKIGESFCLGKPWHKVLKYPEQISAISKEQVMATAQKYFGNNYIRLISKTGFPKKEKLAKPPFSPVITKQDSSSAYAKYFQTIPSGTPQTRFINFEKDVDRIQLESGHQIMCVKNPVNNIFSLNIDFKIGSLHDAQLSQVASYANLIGTDNYTLNALKQKMASLGCTYSIYDRNNYFSINLTGEENHLEEALEILQELFTSPVADAKALQILKNSTQSDRKLQKKSVADVAAALQAYALYGKQSLFFSRNSMASIKKMTAEELLNKFKSIVTDYQAEITFTGKKSAAELSQLLGEKLSLAKEAKAEEEQFLQAQKQTDKVKIYFIHQKKARQSRINFHVAGGKTDYKAIPQVKAFNEYFGGGFSGLVLQEIREYRSLAYTASGRYNLGARPHLNGQLSTFIGCQADKSIEAIKVMLGLINNLPQKEDRMAALQEILTSKAKSSYPNFRVLTNYISFYEKRGLTTDPNLESIKVFQQLEMDDILSFYKKNIQGRPITITICGDKSQIDFSALEQLGKVVTLTVPQVMPQ